MKPASRRIVFTTAIANLLVTLLFSALICRQLVKAYDTGKPEQFVKLILLNDDLDRIKDHVLNAVATWFEV